MTRKAKPRQDKPRQGTPSQATRTGEQEGKARQDWGEWRKNTLIPTVKARKGVRGSDREGEGEGEVREDLRLGVGGKRRVCGGGVREREAVSYCERDRSLSVRVRV
ncbi:hypothetical protein E2C01_091501 [Portunus trituberculatus]|uniref:Uncharacterized protein n=1 Tax=Portunus trituberculatus TaxID=210409 RepID=A0A5B7JP84_PORTR|nr:hypothetical protein [Portunus trituberculatus]